MPSFQQQILGHPAEAIAIEDDKIMYGVYTRRFILQANNRVAAFVDTNTFMARKGLIIRNCSSVPGDTLSQPSTDVAYWGGPDVTPANGMPINPGEMVMFDFRAKKRVDFYIITDQASGIQMSVGELL
jgi:hypothetical protein